MGGYFFMNLQSGTGSGFLSFLVFIANVEILIIINMNRMLDINDNYKAYLYQIVSSLFIVVNQVNLRFTSSYIHPTLALGIRGTILFMFNYFLISSAKKSLLIAKRQDLKTLLKRSIFSTITINLLFIPVKYIPIGIVNTLFNSSPIFVFFVERFYFKKIKFNKMHFLLILLCFIGIVLVLQPEFIFKENSIKTEDYPFYFMALGSAISSAFSLLFLHKLSGKVQKLTAIQYNYTFQLFTNYFLYIVAIDEGPPEFEGPFDISVFILMLLLIAVTSYLAQHTRTSAMFLGKPSYVAPFGYVGLLASVSIDIFIFKSNFNIWTMIGIFLTSIGLLTNFFMKIQD